MEATLNSSLGRQMLGQTPLRIGRAPDNALVISDPQSSSHHAEVAPGFDGNSYQITDLNSTNGTFVNEQRLPPNMPRPLTSGDVIRIGSTNFNYEVSGIGYAPTVAAAPLSYAPTVAAALPQDPYQAPDPYQQPPSNYGAPPPTPYAPPAPPVYPPVQSAYPAAQSAYPAAQPAYPQTGYPQPAYPQVGYSQPGYPPKKKSRVGLWIAIIVILLVLIGGSAGVYLATRSTPQKTLAAYCDGWKTGNAQEIYNQVDRHLQSQTSVSDIQKVLDLAKTEGGITNCTVGSVTEDSSTATAIVTFVIKGRSSSETDTLIKENGTWKLDDSKSNDV